MGSIPLALSVHHFISSVGADAGFASIIGLAILVLLYFAQARETATLRDHAYEAADRIQQLEARIAQLTGRGGTPAPPATAMTEPPPATQPPASTRPAAAAVAAESAAPAPTRSRTPDSAPVAPVAPAGMGAPALTAATRLIPSAAPAGTVALAHGVDSPAESASAPAERPPGPPPATVAGAANGTGREGSRGGAVAAPPPRVQARPGAAPPGRRPPGQGAPRSRPPQGKGPNRVIVGVLAALGVAAVVGLLIVLTSGSGGSSQNHTTATTSAQATHRARKVAVTPSSVTVAVLNGTSTPGLAAAIGLKLSNKGYKQGMVATASDQTATTTTVAYLPGFRRDAVSVAAALKVGAGAVQPVDQSAQAVACPPPAACNANVVVTVGSDLATTQ